MNRPLVLAQLLAVALLLSAVALLAQQKPAAAPAPGAAASSKTEAASVQAPSPKFELEPDEKAYRDASHVADPLERAKALVKFVGDYPQYPDIRNVVFALFHSPKLTMKDLQEPPKPDPVLMKVVVDEFVAGTANAPAYARTEFYYGIAKNLLANEILLDSAGDLARKAVKLLNEEDYVANERRKWAIKERYAQRRDPKAHIDPFRVEEPKAHFRAFAAAVNATVGTVLLKTGDLDGAAEGFRQAYKIEPIVEAAVGLSEISERRGDSTGALKYMMDAALTGKLTGPKIKRLEELYASAHGGKSDGLQEELDSIYESRFQPAIHPVRYESSPGRSHRVVIVEFFTGSGCEPCAAVDLAFDGVMKRYSRDEVALLYYHLHAPAPDPMSNASAEERVKYYDVHGAPNVFLDGQLIHPGDGMKTEAQRVYDALDVEIGKRLTIAETAHIDLTAILQDGVVKTDVSVRDVAQSEHPMRLMIALVEDEVSYSGENGLRFHPMVVRNLAGAQGSEASGFALEPGKDSHIQHAFDLAQISDKNLKYYDWFAADIYKRVGMKATFKELRYTMDPKRLSVVAFVQDQTTKQVLQAAFVHAIAAKRSANATAAR